MTLPFYLVLMLLCDFLDPQSSRWDMLGSRVSVGTCINRLVLTLKQFDFSGDWFLGRRVHNWRQLLACCAISTSCRVQLELPRSLLKVVFSQPGSFRLKGKKMPVHPIQRGLMSPGSLMRETDGSRTCMVVLAGFEGGVHEFRITKGKS